jgi:hypothetical protein
VIYPNARFLAVAAALALLAPSGAARAAQKAHGRPHARYATELAARIAPTSDGDASLALVEATAADASHPRALRLRFRNASQKAIAGFSWHWAWDGVRCPRLADMVGARRSYGAGAVEPGGVVDVYLSPESVRDLLRTTRKRCGHGTSLRLAVTAVRFADGSRSR